MVRSLDLTGADVCGTGGATGASVVGGGAIAVSDGGGILGIRFNWST